MARPDIVTLVNRETQTSDTAVYRKDLPKDLGISAIDLGFRLTNGSTSAVNKDLLDVLKKIEIIFNGTDRRVSLTGQEMFRLNWMKFGQPLFYNWDQSGSVVQEVWLRHRFGRYVGDDQYGLDTAKFNNVQIAVDYDNTVWGAAAVTTFTTGTFAPTIMLHSFPAGRKPGFRGMLGAREIWNYTTVGGNINKDVELPTSNPIAAIALFCMEDNIAEGTDCIDVILGKDEFATRWVDGKWYNLQKQMAKFLSINSEMFKLYATAADSLDCHLANIKTVNAFGTETSWVTTATHGVLNSVAGNAPTGNRATIAGSTLTLDKDTATTQTTSGLSAKAAWVELIGDLHGILYFPFGDQQTLADILQTADLKTAKVRMTDDAAGAYDAVVVEEVYT